MKIIYVVFLFIAFTQANAQRVGIGTSSPGKLLSVKGSILVDEGNENAGSLDSAALVFGTSTGVGIASRRVGANALNGLDFYTGNLRRMRIDLGGFVGIGTAFPQYPLDVNGSILAQQNLYTYGNLSADGNTVIGGRLEAWGDATLRTTDILGDLNLNTTNPTIQLKQAGTNKGFLQLSGDNIRIGTNSGNTAGNFIIRNNGADRITVDGSGNMDVQGKITQDGRAVMLSSSGTTLKAGFTSGSFNISIGTGQAVDITFIVPTFSGNNNNIRVSIAQFQPGAGSSNWGSVIMTPHSVDASDAAYGNASTVKVRFHNVGSSAANLGTGAVLNLYSVVTQ